MATGKKTKQTIDVGSLRKENSLLKKQLAELTAERDSYRRALHQWAKEWVTEERVRGWMAEERVEGSLMEFINEAKSAR